VREICEFIGEEFTATMVEVLGTVRLDATDVDARDPGVASFIDLYAGRMLTQLGYEREARPARQRLAEALPIWPVNRVTMAAWRVTRGAALNRQAKS
jgi:hypothetical protein